MLLCSVASALPAVAGAADPAPQGYVAPPNPRDFAVPLAVEQSSPADIEASETAHADVAPAETGALAERSFPGIFSGLGGGVLPESVEVLDYRGESAALVDRPGDAGTALLDASLPLRVSEGGEKRPVELGLEAAPAAEDALEPARPLVDVSLPERLDQGIEVAGGEFTVSVAGAGDAGAAHPLADGDAVIYPEVATDTDFVAAPTLTGLEVFAQLRSVDSPQRLTMPLELPPGARLEETAIGGAQITRDEQRATVLPPLASDADGNAVEVEMSVEGGALALAIPHREQSIRYPVLVDPVYDFFSWNGSLYGIYEPHGADGQIWQAWATPGSPQRFEAPTGVGVYSGLYIHSDPGSYPYGTVAHWKYGVPHSTAAGPQSQTTTTAYVSEAWMNDYWHGTDNPPIGGDHDWAPFVEFCLVDVGPFTCITGQNGNNTAYMSFHGAEERFEANSIHLVNVRDAEGRRNQEVERVGFGHASDAYPNPVLGTRRWSHIGSASVAIEDGEVPTVTKSNVMTSGAAFPTGWTNSTANARVTVTGQDGGLGVKTMRVGLDCDANGTCVQNPAPWAIPPTVTPPVNDTPGQCQGTKRTGVCPQQATRSHTYSLGSLPQGIVSNYARATDALDKDSSLAQGRWQVKVDRSNPVVQPPSGSLFNERANIVRSRAYELSFLATDGNRSADSQMRSGVEAVEVWVDDESTPRFTSPVTPCTHPQGSCELQATWEISPGELEDLTPGPHTVRMVAVDRLGHRGERSLAITIRDDPDEPAVSITAAPPAGDGSYRLDVNASDPPVEDGYGSGVERIEIYLDDGFIDSRDCSVPRCSIAWSRQMNANQSPDQHEVAVVAYDRAGNTRVQFFGRQSGEQGEDYRHFGYNDRFDWDPPNRPPALDKAGAGGAEVIRFPVAWCEITISESPTDPQTQWNWHNADVFFDKVETYNNGPAANIQTIPVLYDAPPFAQDGGSSAGGCDAAEGVSPPANTDEAVAHWRGFVAAFTARYGPGGTHSEANLLAVEAWNEPNLARWWGGGDQQNFVPQPQLFARLVNRAATVTSVPVLSGGLATAEPVYNNDDPQVGQPNLLDNPDEFMRRAISGEGPKIDAAAIEGVSLHLFANRERNTREAGKLIRQRYRSIEDVLDGQPTFASEPRWITEIGFPSGGAAGVEFLEHNSDYKQYQRLIEAYRHFKGDDQIKSFIVHRFRDAAIRREDQREGEDFEPGRFGVVHRDSDDPDDRQGAAKAIYCWLADRVLPGQGTGLTCESKRRPHAS